MFSAITEFICIWSCNAISCAIICIVLAFFTIVGVAFEAILNAFNDCGQFKKDASVSVVVNVENKESINDWQLSSCYWVAVWQSQSEIW